MKTGLWKPIALGFINGGELKSGRRIEEAGSGGVVLVLILTGRFWGSVKVTNRGLSIAVLKCFVKQRQIEIENGKLRAKRKVKSAMGTPLPNYFVDPEEIGGFKVFEGLAASGLRFFELCPRVLRSH